MTNDERVQWVALEMWNYAWGTEHEFLYEQGGIYLGEPRCDASGEGTVYRRLEPGEREAACPRCGQRFVGVDDSPAEVWRDQHYYGDPPEADGFPSICAHLPAKLTLVGRRAEEPDGPDGLDAA
jgi:hypothetical protein